MTKEEFQTIELSMTQLISDMSEIKQISRNISNYTVDQMNQLIIKARAVQKRAQLFLTSDLYHLLGMGGLNAAQKAKIIKKTGAISSAKADIMSLAEMELIQILERGPMGRYKLHITPIVLEKER